MNQPTALPARPSPIRSPLYWTLIIAAFGLLFFAINDAVRLLPTSSRVVVSSTSTTRKAKSIITALHAYRSAHDNHFPPDLACLILDRSLAPDQLTLPGGSTPYQLTASLPESDWPRIAPDVAAHSDFVYTGADFTFRAPSDLGRVFSQIIVLYSKPLPTYSYRIIGFADGHVTYEPTDLPALFAASNAARATLGLPPFTLDGPPPLPPSVPSVTTRP